MTENEISKFIALILRHKPGTIGIKLDEHGWANVDELLVGINKVYPFTMDGLEEIVCTDAKQRYSFNEDKTLIRANQGHSIPVDVELEEAHPPLFLYHGTGEKYVSSIDAQGLISKSRLYVHLSSDCNNAVKVGSRHGKPVVYRIFAKGMEMDGYPFYISKNGVWLTKSVPVKYLEKYNFDETLVASVANEIKKLFSAEDILEIIEDKMIPEYGWEYLQQALFAVLLDDSMIEHDYKICADIIWNAVLDGYEIETKTAIGLLYYRLGDVNAPYENNTIWSIAAKLYKLDFGSSGYNPLKDDEILKELSLYGINLE